MKETVKEYSEREHKNTWIEIYKIGHGVVLI